MPGLLTALVMMLAAVVSGHAATDSVAPRALRPVTSAYTLSLGSSHLRDTYLTPVKYTGWSAAIGYERFQAMRFDPENWIMRLQGTASVGASENHSGSARMWSLDFRPSWSMMRRYRVAAAPGLTLAVGGIAAADLGVLYLARNGNNPASAKAAVTLGVTGMATYNLRLGRLPVTLRYQPSLPLLGAFFAPDYDELYYEIWLGNHSGLCRFAWPGSYVNLENLVTADLRFGATNLRLGYSNRVFSTKAAGIVTRHIEHSFVIGVTAEWLSLPSGRRHVSQAPVIPAFY